MSHTCFVGISIFIEENRLVSSIVIYKFSSSGQKCKVRKKVVVFSESPWQPQRTISLFILSSFPKKRYWKAPPLSMHLLVWNRIPIRLLGGEKREPRKTRLYLPPSSKWDNNIAKKVQTQHFLIFFEWSVSWEKKIPL